MRAAGTAIEPGIDARTVEGALEEAEILPRRAQEHGHLVEADAMCSFHENTAGDFDALAPFARRGEQLHVASRLALRQLACGEERSPQRGEVGFTGRFEHRIGTSSCFR